MKDIAGGMLSGWVAAAVISGLVTGPLAVIGIGLVVFSAVAACVKAQ